MEDKTKKPLSKLLITSTFWSLFSRIFSIIIRSVIFVYLVNLLGPSEYGIYSSILAIISLFAVFFDFGISPSAAKYISENKYNFIQIIKQSHILYGITLSVVVLVTIIFSKQIASILNAEFLNDYLLLILLLIFLNVYLRFLRKIFEGLNRVDISSKIYTVTEWLPWVFGIILVILFEKTAEFALYGKAIGVFMGISLLAFSLIKLLYKNNLSLISNPKQLSYRKFINYAVPLLLTSISFYIYSRSDILMIQAFLGEYQVGIYGTAIQMQDILHIPSAAIGSAIAGSFFLLKKNNPDKLKSLVTRSTRYVLIFYLPVGIGMLLLSDEIFNLLFGTEFSQSSIVTMIYVPSLIMKGISGVYSLALDYMGYAKKRAIAISISAGLNIALNFFLIPRYGIIGAAWATQITYVPVVFWYIHTLTKEVNVNRKQLLKVSNPIFIAALLMGVIVFLLKILSLHVVIIIGSGVIAYLIFLSLLKGIKRDEINFLFNILNI